MSKTQSKGKGKGKTRSKSKHKSNSKQQKQTVKRWKKGDFYSGDGFVTSIWGPAQWHMLHTISFNYPVSPTPAQQQQYYRYVKSLQHVLPCGACRKNLTANFKKLPLTMKHMANRDTFSRYVYDLHELVNTMLHKSSHLTYEQVRERYEHFRARCTNANENNGHDDPINGSGGNLAKDKDKDKEEKTTTPPNKKEKGCTEPLYGKKARCILSIVPEEKKGQSIQIDQQCLKTVK